MRRPAMRMMDQDGDGYLSQKEFDDARARHMATRNRPGMAMSNPPRAPAFPDIDSNGDGRISPQEMEAFRAARMRRWGQYPQ
jgi:Ca2+-binding EF-hand superfamily protein